MKKKSIIFLVIILVIFLLLGWFTYNNWNTINAFINSIRYSQEDVEKNVNNTKEEIQKIIDKDENIVVRDLTSEEAEALNKGDITEEEAINILTGKKEDVANSGKADNSSAFKNKEPDNNINEASKKVSEAIAKLYIQKNTYLSKLDVIEEEARTKYLSMKEMERQDRKSTLLSEYLPKVGQWEKDCDNVVYGIIDEIKIALKEAGQPDNITEKLKKAYLDEKSAKKTYFINRYMD